MNGRRPLTVLLTVIAYVVATFGVQGTSHFVINADHYANIPIMRTEPLVPIGLVSMVVQGMVRDPVHRIMDRRRRGCRRGPVCRVRSIPRTPASPQCVHRRRCCDTVDTQLMRDPTGESRSGSRRRTAPRFRHHGFGHAQTGAIVFLVVEA